MEYFSQLKFAAPQSRRRKILSDVMPVGEGWLYFIALSDAYLTLNAGERHIRSLSDLRDATNCRDSLQALQLARAGGKLTEGRHVLPDGITACLVQCGSKTSSVRQWSFGADKPTIRTLPTSELDGVWVGHDIEEIEVVDQAAHWYFRIRDDEALIFLAARGGSLTEQIKGCSTYCVEVSGEFIYAL